MKAEELIKTLEQNPSESLYLLECGEIIIWDKVSLTAYSSQGTHVNAIMNPMIDLRTHIGHALLWCKQIEVFASSYEITVLLKTIYEFVLADSNKNYRVYSLIKKEDV